MSQSSITVDEIFNHTGVFLLLERVRFDDLLDELTKAGAVLLAFEHFAVDGDFGVERLFGIQEHLELDHESLALLSHLANLRVAVVERRLVRPLIVLQLVVQLLYLLLQQRVLQFILILLNRRID